MQDKRQHKGFYLLFGSEWHKKVSSPFFQYKIRFHCTLLLLLLLDEAQEIQTQLWVTFSRNNVKCDCSRLETWESARLGGIEVKRQIHFCSTLSVFVRYSLDGLLCPSVVSVFSGMTEWGMSPRAVSLAQNRECDVPNKSPIITVSLLLLPPSHRHWFRFIIQCRLTFVGWMCESGGQCLIYCHLSADV